MDELLAYIVNLPRPAVFVIFIGIGWLLGRMLGNFAKNFFANNAAYYLTMAACVLIAVLLPNHVLPGFKQSGSTITVMEDLKKNRLMQALFKHHPEAEMEMRDKMEALLSRPGIDEKAVFQESQRASAAIMAKYFKEHLVLAPDQAVQKLIAHQYKTMQGFRDKPRLCVTYYLGAPQFEREDLTPQFLESESSVKAELIEAAVANPTPAPAAPADMNALSKEIADAYVKKGYTTEDLAKVGQVETLPPAQGCAAAIKFVEVFSTLSPDRAAYIFKSTIAQQQPAQK